jgi:hypothetical protein
LISYKLILNLNVNWFLLFNSNYKAILEKGPYNKIALNFSLFLLTPKDRLKSI